MLIKRPDALVPSEITPRDVYLRRREVMKAAGAAALAAVLPAMPAAAAGRFAGVGKSRYSTDEKAATFREITTYNNYYEFGTDKGSPARYANKLRTSPWTLVVEGEVREPRTYGIEELLQLPARGACLPPELRRGLVDRRPVGRIRSKNSSSRSADGKRKVRGVRDRCTDPRTCRACARACSTGPMSKACVWTRRCIR